MPRATDPSQQTADPVGEPSTPWSGQGGEQVEIELLFHPDLRRIGERLVVGPASGLGEVLIGRDSPGFLADGGGPPRPLSDPCVSRGQLRVRFSPERRSFSVSAEPGARRPLRLFDGEGRPLERPGSELPPGTLVAIGDRVLLLLTVRPSERVEAEPLLLGHSAPMVALRRRLATLAPLPDTVLVCGETGAGKELAAQVLHAGSRRRGGPLVAVNCAALPENLVESELFGHVRGAFSGAGAPREGVFAAARGGTLLLDEIGELPLSAQPKLLRALELKHVRPLGGSAELAVDARVVAATNRDLAVEVAEGRFRADLFARLEAPRVLVPPLRERRDDVPLLFSTLLLRRAVELGEPGQPGGQSGPAARLSALFRPADTQPPPLPMEHVLALLRHRWPRNVRELLKHVVELSSAVCEGRPLAGPAQPGPQAGAAVIPDGDEPRRFLRPDEQALLAALEEHDYVQRRAAAALGVPYPTLDRWMREAGISRPRDLTPAAIEDARRRSGGRLEEMARLLRVSSRGLRMRMGELGLEA